MRRLSQAAALLFVGSLLAVATHGGPGATPSPVVAVAPAALSDAALAAPLPTAAPATPSAAPPATTAAPTPTTAVTATVELASAPPPTLLPPITLPLLSPPTTAAPPAPAAAPTAAAAAGSLAPYLGLGTWVDVYDWSVLYSKGAPTVGPGDVASMVSAGIQTLFLQASKHDSPTDILEPERLQPIIDAAHHAGIRVVVWYLPTLVDTGADLRRIKAVAALRHTDGLAIDIEARNVADIGERNRRLVALSAALRSELPGRTIGGILLPPVALEVINPKFWPAFPYREIAPFYDVWMTMAYWTNRTPRSGYRDAFRYTKENVDRLRNNLGQPNAPIHPIGGIGNRTSAADVKGYIGALNAVHAIGGSIYDWHTTNPAFWPQMRGIRFQ